MSSLCFLLTPRTLGAQLRICYGGFPQPALGVKDVTTKIVL
jgi:hypothetical protein